LFSIEVKKKIDVRGCRRVLRGEAGLQNVSADFVLPRKALSNVFADMRKQVKIEKVD
jgi:hypothetical protein